jgi:transcriptional/translational regulatory protein YebC/TACO1
MSPSTTVPVAGEREAEKLLALVDALEEQDDVQHVYANFDIPAEQLERISQAV